MMKSRISDKTRLKRGLGQGEGINYKPYLRPRHFSSKGCTTRILGHTVKREHVVFSNLEHSVFCLIDFEDSVIDIQEQFPLLPITRTQEIAAELNIRHPRDKENTDVVMTTDFLVTQKLQDKVIKIAVTVKPSSLLGARTIQKFQIEKEYWKRQNVEWVIVTEKQLDPIKLNNVKVIREHYNIDSPFTSSLLNEFKAHPLNTSLTIREFLKATALKLKIQFGECFRIFYHLLATKQVWFDTTTNLNLDLPLTNFKIAQS